MKNNLTLDVGVTAGAQPRCGTNPRRRILLVDDDSNLRCLNTAVLTSSGCQVDEAKEGAAAWDALQLNCYDLLITDNNMPKLSGIELLKKLHAANMSLPIIMATGALPQAEFTRSPWLQPTATLLKPFTIDELLEIVQKVLRAAGCAGEQTEPLPIGRSEPSADGEIRTPMTGVVGFANLLAGTALTLEQRDYVDGIRSSGESLLTLINDILDFSKIEAGRLELESRPFDVRLAVEKAAALLAARAREKGLLLTVAIDPHVPAAISGDAGRLRQILLNLLNNAVKFTEKGEVTLTVTAGEAPGGRRRISFLVRDTGPGIAAEHQQRIFDSFSQLDASISRKYGGTGLGLAISRSLAEQMGGQLRVDSQPGQGAAFSFSILAETAEPVPLALPVNGRPADLPALRIILADDNLVNRKVALSLLKRLGYQRSWPSSRYIACSPALSGLA